jgi:hypothetical protein
MSKTAAQVPAVTEGKREEQRMSNLKVLPGREQDASIYLHLTQWFSPGGSLVFWQYFMKY